MEGRPTHDQDSFDTSHFTYPPSSYIRFNQDEQPFSMMPYFGQSPESFLVPTEFTPYQPDPTAYDQELVSSEPAPAPRQLDFTAYQPDPTPRLPDSSPRQKQIFDLPCHLCDGRQLRLDEGKPICSSCSANLERCAHCGADFKTTPRNDRVARLEDSVADLQVLIHQLIRRIDGSQDTHYGKMPSKTTTQKQSTAISNPLVATRDIDWHYPCSIPATLVYDFLVEQLSDLTFRVKKDNGMLVASDPRDNFKWEIKEAEVGTMIQLGMGPNDISRIIHWRPRRAAYFHFDKDRRKWRCRPATSENFVLSSLYFTMLTRLYWAISPETNRKS